MARKPVFEAVVSTYLKADMKNHGETIEYKISYGFELENANPVFKVQMVGNGLVKGRQAPSYSNSDFDKIIEIRDALEKEFNEMDKRVRNAGFEIKGLTTEHSQFSK